MKDVFIAIKEVLAKYVVTTSDNKLTLKNSAGRVVLITLAHDQQDAIFPFKARG